jgi:hypothetical protein
MIAYYIYSLIISPIFGSTNYAGYIISLLYLFILIIGTYLARKNAKRTRIIGYIILSLFLYLMFDITIIAFLLQFF